MLNNLTTKFQEALMQAQQTAGRLGKPEISSLDVLVALLEQEGGILSPILRKASCDPGLLLQAALPFYNYFTCSVQLCDGRVSFPLLCLIKLVMNKDMIFDADG